jgi:hypothetical protein
MTSVLQAVLMHAKKHVKYPATKKDLMEACNNFSDVPSAEKEWFEKKPSSKNVQIRK